MHLICTPHPHPPKICISIISISLGKAAIPRRNEKQRLWKIWGRKEVAHHGRYASGVYCLKFLLNNLCIFSGQLFQPALVDELSIDSKGLISVIVYLKIVRTFYWILFNCNNWRQVEQPSSNTFKLKQIHKKENVNGSFNYWFLKNSFWF